MVHVTGINWLLVSWFLIPWSRVFLVRLKGSHSIKDIFNFVETEKTVPMFTSGLYSDPLEQNTYSIKEIRDENREKLLIHVNKNDNQRLS
jgi:hypothetical protein